MPIISEIIQFDILATGQSDISCKIKETLLIRDLKPALNENVGSEKLLLYKPFIFPADLTRSGYFLFHCHYFLCLVYVFVFKFNCTLGNRLSEDVCWNIRNVKFINERFFHMRCLVMFITAVCLIFLLKLIISHAICQRNRTSLFYKNN